jgi:hypothetical protein
VATKRIQIFGIQIFFNVNSKNKLSKKWEKLPIFQDHRIEKQNPGLKLPKLEVAKVQETYF